MPCGSSFFSTGQRFRHDFNLLQGATVVVSITLWHRHSLGYVFHLSSNRGPCLLLAWEPFAS